jgi:2-haloacid dehalogenase
MSPVPPLPAALVFDVMGTVVDDRGGVRAGTAAVLGRRDDGGTADEVARRTADRLVELLGEVGSGTRPWASHRDLRRVAVREAVAAAGLAPLEPTDEDELSGVVHRFDAWPDSAEALDRLRSVTVVAALSNADPAEIAGFSAHGGLAWHLALSTSAARTFKPDPRAYAVAADALERDPGELMMVAAHAWDLRAAAGTGLRTCFVRRPEEEPAPAGEFELEVDDLHGLADALGAAR